MSLYELFKSLGYSDNDYAAIRTSFGVELIRDESLIKKVNQVYNFLLEYGINNEEIRKMVLLFPSILGVSLENMQNKINFLIKLNYSKKDIIDMIKKFPMLFGLSIENIQGKLDYLISLGYEKEEVLLMIKKHPMIYDLSLSNLNNKYN